MSWRRHTRAPPAAMPPQDMMGKREKRPVRQREPVV